MKKNDFRDGIRLVFGTQARAAEYFGMAERSIRRFVSGESPVPEGVAAELTELMKMPAHAGDLQALIDLAQEIAVRAGWPTGPAAAAILSCAINNARRHLGDEVLDDLLAAPTI